jgi:hypothetical protein
MKKFLLVISILILLTACGDVEKSVEDKIKLNKETDSYESIKGHTSGIVSIKEENDAVKLEKKIVYLESVIKNVKSEMELVDVINEFSEKNPSMTFVGFGSKTGKMYIYSKARPLPSNYTSYERSWYKNSTGDIVHISKEYMNAETSKTEISATKFININNLFEGVLIIDMVVEKK